MSDFFDNYNNTETAPAAEKKRLSKGTRILLVSALAGTILAGTALLLTLTAPKDGDSDGEAAEPETNLSLVTDELANFKTADITNGFGTYIISSYFDIETVAAASENAESLTQPVQRFSIADMSGPLDQEKLTKYLSYLTPLSARDLAEENVSPDDLDKYGLLKPAASVTLNFTEGVQNRLDIGDTAPGTNVTYVYSADTNSVYTVTTTYVTALKERPTFFTKLLILPGYDTAADGAPTVSRVTIKAADSDEPVVIDAIPGRMNGDLTTGINSYRFTQPYVIEIADEKGSGLIYGMYGMNALSAEKAGLTPEDLTAYGIDNPDYIITTTVGGQTYTLTLGKGHVSNEDGVRKLVGFYGTFSAVPDVIYEFGLESLPWVTFRYEDVMSKLFVTPYIYTLKALTIDAADNDPLKFTFSGTADDADNFKCFSEGEPVEADSVKTLYQFIIGARAETLYVEPITTEELVARYTFSYNDDREDTVVEFYESGDRKLIAVVDGNPTCKLRHLYIERLRQNIRAFRDGTQIITSY